MKKLLSLLMALILVLGMIPFTAAAESPTYSLIELASQDRIKLLGRTAPNPEGTGLMCEWAGSGFQMNVSGGGTLSVSLNNNYYSTWVVLVDGEQIFRQHYSSGGDITFSAEIPTGTHTVTVIKDSENQSKATDRTDLLSISFPGTIEDRPADKELLIEYIGDSYTTGMGTLGTYTPGVPWKLYEHSFTGGYAYQSAQMLGADYTIAARAGIGLFDGVSAAQPDDDPEETIADIYPYTAGFRKSGGLYDFANQPDLIILEIGTNDGIDEKDANFTSAKWKEALENMIDLVQEKNPGVPIVLFAAKSAKFKIMKEVVDERNDPNLYCYFFNHQGNGTGNTSHMKGHPSKQDAYFVAQSLNNFLIEKDLVGAKAAEPTYNDYIYYASESGNDTNAGTADAPKKSITGVLEQAKTDRTYQAGDRIVINVTGTVKINHTNGQKLGNVPMVTEDGQQVPILVQTNNFSGTKAKILTGHTSSTDGNAQAFLCNDFTFKNVIFSAAKSSGGYWDYRLYAGWNDIVFDNVTFDHEGDGAPAWRISAGHFANVEGARPPEGAATSTVTFKNGDYTNLDFACVALSNKISANAPDTVYTELPNIDCRLIIEDGAHMGTVYNRYGTMTYGNMEVVVKGGIIDQYIGTPDGTSSSKKAYKGDIKFTMQGGEINGAFFNIAGRYLTLDGDIVNNITGGTIEIHPGTDYDAINFGTRNNGTVDNVRNNISGGMFMIITDGKTSSGGTRASGFYFSGEAYATVTGNVYNNVSGGTFVGLHGKANTSAPVYFGSMSGNIEGTLYNTISGGTFDNAACSGSFYFGSQNYGYYYNKVVNVIGDKDTGKGPCFNGQVVHFGSGYGSLGATEKPTALPDVSQCTDEVVISTTVYAGVFEKTTYFGPSTAPDTANSKYTFVLGSIENNIYGGMFQSYTHCAGRAPVYGKVSTNIYGGNMTSFAGAGYAATVYDGVELNIYGLEEYYNATKGNTFHYWAGSYGADIPVPQTAGRPSLKLTIAPEDPKSLVLKTPISALCNGKNILGDVVVEVSGGVYPNGFGIEGVTVNRALKEGFVCTDTNTGTPLTFADDATVTDAGSITILPMDQVTEPEIPETYIATVVNGQLTQYATTQEELESLVSPTGNSLVTLYADIETQNALVMPYTCTIDMNGHSLWVDPVNTQKNGIWIEASGSQNKVTTVMNGSITAYQVGIRMDGGPVVVKNMDIHCTTGTTIALMDTTAYDRSCTVIGCTLASGSYSQVAFNYKAEDFSNTKVYIVDSTLVSYKNPGTQNFSKQTNTIPGTITLGENVTLYTYASSYAASGITVDGKALTKTTDQTVTAAGQTFTGMNKWQTATESAAMDGNGQGYATVSAALAAQEKGGYVKLLADQTASTVTVREGITLDLNGKTLDAQYLTCYGELTDGSQGGEGLAKAAKRLHIAGQNSYLPIYDNANSGYRFYRYSLENLGGRAVSGNANAVKFGFRLTLQNAAGYDLLSTADHGLALQANLSWEGIPAPLGYRFKDATIENFAQQVAADLAANGTTGKAIVLTVSGLDVLPEGVALNATFTLTSALGTTATSTTSQWQTQGSAIATDAILSSLVRIPARSDFTFHSDLTNTATGELSPIEKDYYLSAYKVTNAQYAVFVAETSHKAPSYWKNGTYPEGKADHPVLNVSYSDAVSYCQWLSAKYEDWTFRLPTEAEWENAAYGDYYGDTSAKYPDGTKSPSYNATTGTLTSTFNFNGVIAAKLLKDYGSSYVINYIKGDFAGTSETLGECISISATGGVTNWANHGGSATKGYFLQTDLYALVSADGGHTTAVGSYPANTLGLYDMAGNSWDITSSIIVASNGLEAGVSCYAVRGGSWYATARSCTLYYRGEGRKDSPSSTVGFRIAADYTPN